LFDICYLLSLQGLAKLVKEHIGSGKSCSSQNVLRCPMCTNATCGKAKEFFKLQQKYISKLGED